MPLGRISFGKFRRRQRLCACYCERALELIRQNKLRGERNANIWSKVRCKMRELPPNKCYHLANPRVCFADLICLNTAHVCLASKCGTNRCHTPIQIVAIIIRLLGCRIAPHSLDANSKTALMLELSFSHHWRFAQQIHNLKFKI